MKKIYCWQCHEECQGPSYLGGTGRKNSFSSKVIQSVFRNSYKLLALRQAVDSLTQMTQEQSIFVVRGRDKIGISAPADIRVSSVSAAENQSVDFKSQILMIIVSQMIVAVKFGDA